MRKQNFFLLLMSLVVIVSCTTTSKNQKENNFVRVENGQFIRNGKPYYYIGTNFWYGAILGSEGEGGNRVRLCRELDSLKSIGIDNLRILVGSDGERGVAAKVEPTLQVAPGVYNDTIFAGLDYLLAEMAKRDMLAVLYLNNSWEWSGGYGQYLQWAGYGKAPQPAVDGYAAYMNFAGQFVCSDSAQALYANYVKDVITRTNRYTNVRYIDDPTIMSWQIGNEPRAFSPEYKQNFANWMGKAAALIKSLDPNHLVSTGSEGKWGCEMDMDLFEKIHADANVDYMNIHIWPYNWGWAPKDHLVSTGSEGKWGCEMDMDLFEKIHADANVDYMNIHIWPYNWGWAPKDRLQENLEKAKQNSKVYIDEHLAVAKKYQKPLVMEEFGYPRDNFQFSKCLW